MILLRQQCANCKKTLPNLAIRRCYLDRPAYTVLTVHVNQLSYYVRQVNWIFDAGFDVINQCFVHIIGPRVHQYTRWGIIIIISNYLFIVAGPLGFLLYSFLNK